MAGLTNASIEVMRSGLPDFTISPIFAGRKTDDSMNAVIELILAGIDNLLAQFAARQVNAREIASVMCQ